jgi:hypothetical protein
VAQRRIHNKTQQFRNVAHHKHAHVHTNLHLLPVSPNPRFPTFPPTRACRRSPCTTSTKDSDKISVGLAASSRVDRCVAREDLPPSPLQLCIRGHCGNNLTLSMDSANTVKDLCEAIKRGIPSQPEPRNQRLTFGDNVLCDLSATLSSCNLTGGSKIKLVCKSAHCTHTLSHALARSRTLSHALARSRTRSHALAHARTRSH